MGNPFDDLTKKLANKELTRRESLRWIGGGFIGAALATLGFGKLIAGESGHPTCPDYCRSLGLTPGGGNAFGKCVENCANCRDAGGTACGAGSCCFDDAVCCPEGTVGATCVSCADGEEFDPTTCTCVATCCQAGGFACGGGAEFCNSNCVCFTSSDGTTQCGDILDQACGSFAVCGADNSCPEGTFCAMNTCCGNVCIPFCDCGDDGGAGKRAVLPATKDSGPMLFSSPVNLK
jgi:hypothetical protein